MEKEFVPYELALKLKQLGFDEPCFGYYNALGNFNLEIHKVNADCNKLGMYGKYCTAPTFSQAFRWFREKYELIGHVRESWSFDNILEYVSQINGTFVNHGIFDKPVNRFETYEEAELACLEKLIEIVENNLVD
jgi:hypothetical protein